ncbi:TAR DNA-binding protein 43-like [Daktulosphaira vitifoliae]|uniref:TAR DNA-binding protein 43-like n=1 Tax=Daktulosphaira vitifoliae TaxID=58002 RepID=UPI0021A9B395|nr:TAR DNA-binding protein 43-like [Daktulosphaira vitifoliae]
MSFVQVSETNDGDAEIVDLPLEKDGTLLLSTLHAQYPDACGLKYVAPDNGRTRALRLADEKLHPPTEEGWGDIVYFCSFNKDNGQKRKLNEEYESDVERASKEHKSEASSTAWKNRDLLVLGLPWKTTDEDLESYFSKYGELRMAQVKKTADGRSRGFGFIRFKDQESQVRSMLDSHVINGRRCEIKIPNIKDAFINEAPKKIFVGQLTESITQEDLEDYFKKFGEIVEVFVPRPFKGIAFVSFTKPDAALTALDQDHTIRDVRLSVSVAMPKEKDQRYRGGRSSGGGGGGGGSGHNYNSRARGSRDHHSNRNRYYDDGGWNDYDRGSYSDRYRDSRYDRKTYDNGRSYNSSQVWRKSEYVDSSSSSQSKEVGGQIDPNLVAAVVEKTVRGVIGNMSNVM